MIMLNIFCTVLNNSTCVTVINTSDYDFIIINNNINLKQKTNTVIHAGFPLPPQIVTNRLGEERGNVASVEM